MSIFKKAPDRWLLLRWAPHRVVYRLCNEVDRLRAEVAGLCGEVDEDTPEPGCWSCVDSGEWDRIPPGRDACIGGELYGFCSSPNCAGLCEPFDRCDCSCHDKEPRGDTP